jgi:phage terminase large subunit
VNGYDHHAQPEFPAKATILFEPAPYKVFYGGRGGSKTWDFCRALLILGRRRKLFILCAREFQRSIAESVHRTLDEQIRAMNLDHFYTVLAHKIVGANGTEFVFAGVRNNIGAIKSMESIDICAVFEATFVSEHSWQVLLPTIRRDPPHGPFEQGSEVWIEFNPELATDYTYRYWVLEPPEGTKVVEINWRDNPWFPEVLLAQKNDLKKRDHDSYLTVWEGKTRRTLQGAIYAKEIELAAKEGRISPSIAVDRSKPVNVSVDLGRADTTSLWFSQQVGTEHRFVDYYGNFGFDWGHYLDTMLTGIGEDPIEKRKRRYQIGTIYLPHDASSKHLAARNSIARQTKDAYPGESRVQVVPRTESIVNDINAVRAMFSRMYFHEKNCADGLTGLAHYRYEVDPDNAKEVSQKPLHDWASHPADSLRCYVMGLKADSNQPRPQPHQPRVMPPRNDGLGWMRA